MLHFKESVSFSLQEILICTTSWVRLGAMEVSNEPLAMLIIHIKHASSHVHALNLYDAYYDTPNQD